MNKFEELQAALRAAIELHFEALKARHESNDLYGYSLYTDDSICSIGPVANTTEKIPVSVNDPTHGYYRYGPHEWALFDDFGLFEAVSKIVKGIHEDPDLSFEAKREGMLEAALQALVNLEAEGRFGPRTASRFVVLWLVDSSDPIMSVSAETLNSPAVFAAYRAEYGDEA
jgi:hypothetical protein